MLAPFDTELFGHWWHEGIEFVADLYRHFASRGGVETRTASGHLAARPPDRAIALARGSWGANGDFSMWLNPQTALDLGAPVAAGRVVLGCGRRSIPGLPRRVLAQAARELLLAQSSDWQFIISTGAAADYATRRFNGSTARNAGRIRRSGRVTKGELPAAPGGGGCRQRDRLFPDTSQPRPRSAAPAPSSSANPADPPSASFGLHLHQPVGNFDHVFEPARPPMSTAR